jgi:hypothetical protein
LQFLGERRNSLLDRSTRHSRRQGIRGGNYRRHRFVPRHGSDLLIKLHVSPQIHREIERAVSKGLTIIPFRIEEITPTEAMEYYLGAIHWLDAITPPLTRHLGQLVDQVNGSLQSGPPARAPLAQHAPKSSRLLLLGGLAALGLLCGALLAIWQGPGLLRYLRPATPLTVTDKIFSDLLRASHSEPLAFDEPTGPIGLQPLAESIRINYPSELLFWLYADRFELRLPELGANGYQYSPPVDLGCNSADAKHRCFIDWVHAMTLAGLSVEAKSQVKYVSAQPNRPQSAPITYRFARFCFDPVLARQAAARTPQLATIATRDLDITPAEVYAGQLGCASPNWQPEKTAYDPQPETLPLTFRNGAIQIAIVPRSTYGLFEFLGSLIKLQQEGYQPRPYPPVDARHYPPARTWVGDVPPRLATVNNEPLITIARNYSGKCFARSRFEGEDYCVPDSATVTKQVFGILSRLMPSAAQN